MPSSRWLRSWREKGRRSSRYIPAGSARPALFPTPSCGANSRPPAAATSNRLRHQTGCDIKQLADVLGLERPILGGFNWGGNASCVAAALWPERFGGLVSYAGYDVIDINAQRHPVAPSLERVFWYQHLFQIE